MSAVEHDHAQLGAYVLGALEPGEAERFEAHLATCGDCAHEVAELSALRDELDEVPPEAFLDGPPEGGDLLLQRTLRSIRAEDPPRARPRLLTLAGAAAVLAVVALGAGVLVGRGTAPETTASPAPPTATGESRAPGTRTLTATDAQTGVSLVADVTPLSGWVNLHVALTGVKDGEKCQLVVVPKQGAPVTAGSWVVTAKGQAEGIGVYGAALVAPEDIASVDIVTLDGRKLVSAPA
jgi:anti-sigma-K factor RskA